MLNPTFDNRVIQGSILPDDKKSYVIQNATKQAEGKDFSRNGWFVEVKDNKSQQIWQVLITWGGETRFSLYVIDPTKFVGKGGQGQVVLAQEITSEQWAAVKILKPGMPSFEEDVIREERNLKLCERLLGTAVDGASNVYILMPYYSGRSLLSYLYETDNSVAKNLPQHFTAKKQLDILLMLRLVVQVIEQIIWLHEKELAHRDIKTENFVLDIRGVLRHLVELKLIDMGTAIHLGKKESEQCKEIAGTFGYNDPYLLDNRVNYDYRFDLFSIGVVLAEICTAYNYQASLREKLQELQVKSEKRELYFEEIRNLMPDMFAMIESDCVSALPVVEQMRLTIIKEIKHVIFLSTLEEPSARPTLSRMKEILITLKSLSAKANIEAAFIKPADSFDGYQRERQSSTDTDSVSPRNSDQNTVDHSISRRSKSVSILNMNQLASHKGDMPALPKSPKSARQAVKDEHPGQRNKIENKNAANITLVKEEEVASLEVQIDKVSLSCVSSGRESRLKPKST
jgi:serine/threonine protein kinase